VNWLHRILALNAGSGRRSESARIIVPTFTETGEGKTDKDLGRGDEGDVGAFEWLVRLIEMSVPPSRMLFRAFNL